MDLSTVGKWIVLTGLGVAAAGVIIWLGGRWGLPFGSFPGDLRIDRPGFSFRFLFGTSIILTDVPGSE